MLTNSHKNHRVPRNHIKNNCDEQINPVEWNTNYTARLEKTIASEIVNNEVNIENDVNKKLNSIIELQIQIVQKQKRTVAKCHQDNETARQKYQVRIVAHNILLITYFPFVHHIADSRLKWDHCCECEWWRKFGETKKFAK